MASCSSFSSIYSPSPQNLQLRQMETVHLPNTTVQQHCQNSISTLAISKKWLTSIRRNQRATLLCASQNQNPPSEGRKPGRRRKIFKSPAEKESPLEAKAAQNQLNSNSGEHVDAVAESALRKEQSAGSGEEINSRVVSEEEFAEGDCPYVIYEPRKPVVLDDYERAKKYGEPHPFMPPGTEKKESLPRDRLWWNFRENPDEIWSRWNRRVPTADWVMAKAMAETGQIKLFGENPTVTETTLAKARKEVFKNERLQAEEERKKEIGPLAYYKEWVKAWDRDTSQEAIKKHFEETGEDEHEQLIDMLKCQTQREYRIMMGTDVRIKRDPLVMRMRPELKMEAFGGDPVFPVVNYEQAPDHVVDFRSPNYHEPSKTVIQIMKEKGICITKEELRKMQEEEENDFEAPEEYNMVEAIDIGEDEDVEEAEQDDEDEDAKLSLDGFDDDNDGGGGDDDQIDADEGLSLDGDEE